MSDQAALARALNALGPKPEPNPTLGLAVLVLVIPVFAMNLWTAWSAYTIVLVPLGAPHLSIWYIWAIRSTARWMWPGRFYHDSRPADEKNKETLLIQAITLVLGPIVVWWLFPWLVSP